MPARSCLADRRRFCRDTPVRPCKNRIQESHQFGRGQHSSYADPVPAPCFHHGPPGQPPAPAGGAASVPAGRGPAGLGTRLARRLGADRARRAARQALLAGRRPRAGPGPLAGHPGPAQPRALADPVGAGPQRAAQFPAAGQVTAGPGAQREELVVAGLIVVPPVYPGRRGEPVVGVGPHRGLLGIAARGPYPVGQPGELVAAALAHRGERGRVPAQLQRDLVCAARPVAAGHRGHRQDRSINAT